MDALENGIGNQDIVDDPVAKIVQSHCLEELLSGLADFCFILFGGCLIGTLV